MIRKARKKPVEINYLTFKEVLELQKDNAKNDEILTLNGYEVIYDEGIIENTEFIIQTLEGDMLMTDKDYLIIGVRGEIYPIKIDIFNETYDVIE